MRICRIRSQRDSDLLEALKTQTAMMYTSPHATITKSRAFESKGVELEDHETCTGSYLQ
jgi:hypothetical protein